MTSGADQPRVVRAGWSAVASLWALLAVTVARRRARRTGVAARAPRCWPGIPPSARHGVWFVLDRVGSPTCLERALVLQQWAIAHGRLGDVLVGVPIEGLGSRDIHAWVDGDRKVDASTYRIIHRLHPQVSPDSTQGRP